MATDFDRAFHSTDRVQGYTHDFYKYPARFSPSFVRFILDSLTEPGDCVLDPFMGGGTTIVEAAVSGRRAIGSDLNQLARFVTKVKTTPLSQHDIAEVRRWARDVQNGISRIEPRSQSVESPVKNLPVSTYPFFATATELIESLQFPRRRHFARCALIRVGQWALDGRSAIPSADELGDELEKRVDRMVSGLAEFTAAAQMGGSYKNKITASRRLIESSAADPSLAKMLSQCDNRPKLILTSPPYPGVHVLYHRWQVLGRRETPAPYWIAGIQDGHSESYYTMGSRSELGLKNYFSGIAAAFSNLRKTVTPDTAVVQLISFSNTTVQLPIYLDAMTTAGFEETSIGGIDSRKMRSVPHRKWYNNGRTWNDSSREVLLVHSPIDV